MDRKFPLNSDEPILSKISSLAETMHPDEFLDLMYEVAAEMAEEGVPVDELVMLCDRVCGRLAVSLSRLLH